jgi:hypothetical protein
MKKRYTIRRKDFFNAMASGALPQDCSILYAGSLWMEVALTDEERAAYTFPIS